MLSVQRRRFRPVCRYRRWLLDRPYPTVLRDSGNAMGRPQASGLIADQREPLEDLLQVHDLAGDELGDGEPDEIDTAVDVGNQTMDFGTRQAAEVGTQSQLDLVGVDRVDVEVDRHLRGAGGAQPVE